MSRASVPIWTCSSWPRARCSDRPSGRARPESGCAARGRSSALDRSPDEPPRCASASAWQRRLACHPRSSPPRSPRARRAARAPGGACRADDRAHRPTAADGLASRERSATFLQDVDAGLRGERLSGLRQAALRPRAACDRARSRCARASGGERLCGRSVPISARVASARAGTSSRGIACVAGASPSADWAKGICARAVDPDIQTAEIATRSAVRRARRMRRTGGGG